MTETQDATPHRRTGRPYRAPMDLTAPGAPVPEQRPRLAWLLGINRMLRHEGQYAHRRDFLAALGEQGITCDESKLSRWESGAAAVPDEAVRAYEEILGLTPHSLRGAISFEIDPSPLRRVRAHGPAEIDRLVTAMLEGNATGQDWMEFTDELLGERQIYLRAADWAQLTTQLLSEQSRAAGGAYVARAVAATRLAAHPAAQKQFVRSVGALVLDDRVRRRGAAVRLLASVPGQRAWSLMLRLCTTGALTVRLGAIEVAIRHVGDEPRTRKELLTLEAALAQLLEELPGDRTLLALAEQLPDPSPQLRALLAASVPAEPMPITTAERTLAAGLAQTAQAAVQQHRGWDGEPDAMLASLTADALFHPSTRRVRAAFGVLDASPYCLALARAALDLGGRHLKTSHRASRAATRMAHFLQADDGEKLLHIAESARDVRRRAEALTALSGLPDPLLGADLARVNALQESPELVDAAVHALGMLGQLDGLRPTGKKKLDQRALKMASWWHENGARVDV